MKSMPPPMMVSFDEAWKLLGIKQSRLRYLVFTRQIPFIKLSGSIMFKTAALTEWVMALETKIKTQ